MLQCNINAAILRMGQEDQETSAMHSDPDWAAATRHFQQSLVEGWSRALQAFDGSRAAPSFGIPPITHLTFSPEKLAALQEAYLKEAAELWNHGLAGIAAGDKRFAVRGLGQQSGRGVLRRDLPAERAARCSAWPRPPRPIAKTKARLRFAVEQWMAASRAQQLHGAERRSAAEGDRDAAARASPGACRTCCTTCSRAMSR